MSTVPVPLDIGRPTDEAASSAEGDHLVIKKRAELHLQVAPLALLLLYDEGYTAWCPGVHRISCSLSTGHGARLLWASMAVRRPGIFHCFVGLFTATPWGYTNKLFGFEMLLRWEEAENSP